MLEEVRRVERLGVQTVEFADGSLEILDVEHDGPVDQAVAVDPVDGEEFEDDAGVIDLRPSLRQQDMIVAPDGESFELGPPGPSGASRRESFDDRVAADVGETDEWPAVIHDDVIGGPDLTHASGRDCQRKLAPGSVSPVPGGVAGGRSVEFVEPGHGGVEVVVGEHVHRHDQVAADHAAR